MRAFPEPIFPAPRTARLELRTPPQSDTRTTLLLAVPESELHLYPGQQFLRVPARTTVAAMQQLGRSPQLMVIDWDFEEMQGVELCRAAVAMGTSVLVTAQDPASAPPAIRAGCHAILLKPLTPMLIAARLGRLARERGVRTRFAAARAGAPAGTHRVCPETDCPYCATPAPTSFEFSSHRRAWYACLSCDKVWLGARHE